MFVRLKPPELGGQLSPKQHGFDMLAKLKVPGLGLRQVKSVWTWRSAKSKVKWVRHVYLLLLL